MKITFLSMVVTDNRTIRIQKMLNNILVGTNILFNIGTIRFFLVFFDIGIYLFIGTCFVFTVSTRFSCSYSINCVPKNKIMEYSKSTVEYVTSNTQ